MSTVIQVKRDTAANWTANNPVLFQGEQGLETDTKRTKIGDGTTSWTSLGYSNSISNTFGSAPVITTTFSNGTASQLSDTTRDYIVYFQVGVSGTAFGVSIGPTSTPVNAIFSGATVTSGQTITFRLPAGWYVKWSATTATLSSQTAIGC